ncbi:MAG: MnhB domain-containing protein [Nitriliruptoraceae bacterium]
MTGSYPSIVVRVVCALLSPFVLLYGLYIIVHGHYGPGGGFAGGVFVASAAILPRLTLPDRVSYDLIPPVAGPIAAGVGLLIYLLAAVVPLLSGAALLDYHAFAIPGMDLAHVRYYAILAVEIGVGIAVAGAILMIFDVLTERSGT